MAGKRTDRKCTDTAREHTAPLTLHVNLTLSNESLYLIVNSNNSQIVNLNSMIYRCI